MCCKFDKAPPILRNEGWRCLGGVKSLNFSVIFRGALGQRFRAEMSLKSVAEHSWGTNMAQCVARRFLEFLKANGDAFKWWPDLRGVTISYVHESEAG